MKFKMSKTSSVTASRRDRDVPSAEVIYRDKLCLVSITTRDGTLMDASSVSEEDIVEICITKVTPIHWVCSIIPLQNW